jgi:hypothetical protein
MLDPAGGAAGAIATLWLPMLVDSAISFALVMVLFALVDPRISSSPQIATSCSGRRLEIERTDERPLVAQRRSAERVQKCLELGVDRT